MRIVMIEPSPLARNVYRLLLEQYTHGDIAVTACETLPDLARLDTENLYDACIIGSKALRGDDAERWRALLTDAQPWATLPKLIITSGRVSESSAGKPLPHSATLARPFTPEDFEIAVGEMVVEEELC